ncbi:hypothetical protein BpHYR1_051048 [Brachionus plicatilis]|uniref:Uncharacterized protein n=1 Tax=Brachionus plicatilis TaxID=10195 RepID=A0A3M7SUF6_BRAPC|nr:hypothetical protein BpHYR1_051048 [Brachionus plicatilis]
MNSDRQVSLQNNSAATKKTREEKSNAILYVQPPRLCLKNKEMNAVKFDSLLSLEKKEVSLKFGSILLA